MRGSVWITTFVTQDANQLQVCFKRTCYLTPQLYRTYPKIVWYVWTHRSYPALSTLKWAINTLRTFGFRYSVTSTPRSPRRPLNLLSGTLKSPKILPEGYSLWLLGTRAGLCFTCIISFRHDSPMNRFHPSVEPLSPTARYHTQTLHLIQDWSSPDYSVT